MNVAAIDRTYTDTAEPIPVAGIQQAMLPGNRLHLQHGPINLVIKADGDEAAVRRASSCAAQRMQRLVQHPQACSLWMGVVKRSM